MRIFDAANLHYRELNDTIKTLINAGDTEIILKNVKGQRYIGTGMKVITN